MDSMKFSEKLQSKMAELGLNQSQLGRRVEVSQPTIGSYLKGSVPDAMIGRVLAKEVAADQGWLFDDEKGLHDPSAPGASLTDRQVVAEVVRRATARIEALEQVVTQAEKFDWAGFSAEIQAGGQWSETNEDGNVEIAETKLGAAIHLATALNALLISPTFKLMTMWWGETRPKAIIVRIGDIHDALKTKWPGRQAYSDALAITDAKFTNTDVPDYVDSLRRLVGDLEKLQKAEAKASK